MVKVKMVDVAATTVNQSMTKFRRAPPKTCLAF